MLSAERLFFAMTYIDDESINLGGELLGYYKKSHKISPIKKKLRFALIAAIIASLLTISAYAAIHFTLSYRNAKPAERFEVHFSEFSGAWKNAKLVLEFEGPDESREIRFKPNWLPFVPNASMSTAADNEGWYSRLVSEGISDDIKPEAYKGMAQAYMIRTYYTCQYIDGGAMLLLYQSPGEISEETWGELQVMKFNAQQYNKLTEGMDEFNFVLLFDPVGGYVVVVSGMADMATLEHIARELEIEETGNNILHDENANKFIFFDVACG